MIDENERLQEAILAPYNSTWIKIYEKEAQIISKILGDNLDEKLIKF